MKVEVPKGEPRQSLFAAVELALGTLEVAPRPRQV